MDNPVATQDRGRRQTKHKNNTENLKDEQHGPHPTPGGEHICSWREAVLASYKTPSCYSYSQGMFGITMRKHK